jgi:hydrogenase expression/formation protein HypE
MGMNQNPQKKITLAHGNGGKLSHEIYSSLICKHFSNKYLAPLSDSAVLDGKGLRLAFSTDSYVVKPAFFPGGDIGKLAVCGTVNDLAVVGATPSYLSCSLIIEEGFELDKLDTILRSMASVAEQCNVSIVTGDTKVVEHGSADGIFINTAGIGYFDTDDPGFSPERIMRDDKVILSGTIGDHGMAILTSRENFPLNTDIKSDCAPLYSLIRSVLDEIPRTEIRIMRDPTRGGVATTLNEFVSMSRYGITIDESSIPIRNEVQALCEMSGYDPLYIANEGKVLIVASKEVSDQVVSILRAHPLGKNAREIGHATDIRPGIVTLRTSIGGERIIDMLTGDMFPRIC